MERIRLNPIVSCNPEDLTENQLLYTEGLNGRFILSAKQHDGVKPVTPSIPEANPFVKVLNMANENEFKTAFNAFANAESPVSGSATIGTNLYAWKKDATHIVYTTSAIPSTDDSVYNASAYAVTTVKAYTAAAGETAAKITCNSSSYSGDYSRSTADDTVFNTDYNTMFATIKKYLPVESQNGCSPNVTNTFGIVSSNGKTIKCCSKSGDDVIYQKIVYDSNARTYTITAGVLA